MSDNPPPRSPDIDKKGLLAYHFQVAAEHHKEVCALYEHIVQNSIGCPRVIDYYHQRKEVLAREMLAAAKTFEEFLRE